uniref:SH2 domain-containing protein n=1 Tax=Romanomermis culicivorax TaxID=13658 RepID=A0A915HPY1_ROMCU
MQPVLTGARISRRRSAKYLYIMVDVMKLQSFRTVHNVNQNTSAYSSIIIAPKISTRITDYDDESSGKLEDVKFYRKLEDNMWYHAKITRTEAESRVLYNGHFLVRDCISNPGNFVLTCDWDGRPVHFMINRVRLVATIKCITFFPTMDGFPSPESSKLLWCEEADDQILY